MTALHPDGLEALLAEFNLPKIMTTIERTARWVDPATFKLLPVWYPEHARGQRFYKTKWSAAQTNTTQASGTTVHKIEGNTYAGKTLTVALGLSKSNKPNWSCCHIWSVDDAKFQSSNKVLRDYRFYSCVGNMVLLPTPLKAFTDAMPDVKAMLRLCARNLYGWQCDHDVLLSANAALDDWSDWSAYPASWPRSPGERLPQGVMMLNEAIGCAARKRVDAIRHDFQTAGEHYPRDEIYEALSYWQTRKDGSSILPDPDDLPDPRRFAGTAEDVVPMGRIIETIDLTSEQQRLQNARHAEFVKQVSAELREAAFTDTRN